MIPKTQLVRMRLAASLLRLLCSCALHPSVLQSYEIQFDRRQSCNCFGIRAQVSRSGGAGLAVSDAAQGGGGVAGAHTKQMGHSIASVPSSPASGERSQTGRPGEASRSLAASALRHITRCDSLSPCIVMAESHQSGLQTGGVVNDLAH